MMNVCIRELWVPLKFMAGGGLQVRHVMSSHSTYLEALCSEKALVLSMTDLVHRNAERDNMKIH